MDLFDSEAFDELGVPAFSADAPLAVRMRPSRLEEVVGQSHLLGEGAAAASPPVARLSRWCVGIVRGSVGSTGNG